MSDSGTPQSDTPPVSERTKAKQAREYRRGAILNLLMHGTVHNSDIAERLKIHERTVGRDRKVIDQWLAQNYRALANSFPMIHMQLMLGHYEVLAKAWEIVNDSKNHANTRINAIYAYLSTAQRIAELSRLQDITKELADLRQVVGRHKQWSDRGR